MPSDAQRIQRIKHLVDNGFEDKILIAHDIHTLHRMVRVHFFSSNRLKELIRETLIRFYKLVFRIGYMEMGTNYKNLESGQTYVDIGTLTEG